jgi:hypothetical protein
VVVDNVAFPCPQCAKTLKAPIERIGSRSRCPSGGCLVVVPHPYAIVESQDVACAQSAERKDRPRQWLAGWVRTLLIPVSNSSCFAADSTEELGALGTRRC